MMKSKIIMSAPDIFKGDAVGNHCFELSRIFRKFGVSFSLYADQFSEGVFDRLRMFEDVEKEDLLFVSFSIYDHLLDKISRLSNRKLCYFHGITPPKYLQEYEPITAKLCNDGISQIRLLNRFETVVCNSRTTAKLLNGVVEDSKIKIFPPITKSLIDTRGISITGISEHFEIAVVGRITPHKKIEDAIKIISHVKMLHKNVILHIIGSVGNLIYKSKLDQLVNDLNLDQNVNFHGYLEEGDKNRLLKSCKLLLSTSMHEGYGVPIIEAMSKGIPVLVKEKCIDPDSFQSNYIEFKNHESAAQIIDGLIKNNELWNSYSSKVFKFSNMQLEAVSDKSTFEFFSRSIDGGIKKN